MEVLHLQPGQITRQVLNVLNELDNGDKITLTNAKRIVEENIKRNVFTYVGYLDGKPIAVGTIFFMEKLIHGGSTVALIEDVAVKRQFQRKGFGKILIQHLVDKAKRAGCYKVILTCREALEPFYVECGFTYWCEAMRKDLHGG